MTPQQIEAMKLALEALELINIEFVCGNGSHHKKEDRHEWDEDCPITNRWRKAITAIKEALAEHAMRNVQRLGQEIEQEPVAVKRMKEWVEFLKRQSDNGQHMNIPSSFGAGTCWELAIELEQFINTHPPQRKPLTDEEMKKIWYAMQNIMGWYSYQEIARAIEAAHGIKENT